MMAKNNLSLMHIEYLYSQLALNIPHITNQLLFMEIINLLTSINEIVETNKKNINEKTLVKDFKNSNFVPP